MDINLIAAIGKNNELGYNKDLIWKIKGDLKFFKNTTIGLPVVMGRRTFESLPKVLPQRENIVISSTMEDVNKEIKLYRSVKEFLEEYKKYNGDVFVIGGESIYSQFIDLADKIYLTEIDDSKLSDVYFPKFDKNKYSKNLILTNIEDGIKYSHVLYKKK